MTSIAQRRVAGATALMILLYLLQTVLFPMNARAASVDPIFIDTTANQTCTQLLGPGNWIEVKFDPNGDGTVGPVTVSNSQNDKSFDWSSEIAIDAVFVKAGAEGSNLYVYDPASYGDTELVSPGETGNGISHIAFCYDPTPSFQIDACDDQGLASVKFTVENTTELVINGVEASESEPAFQPGNHDIDLAPGSYSWILFSPIDSGTPIANGTFTVGACVTTTTEGTTTTTEGTTTTTEGTTTTTEGTTTTTEGTTTTTEGTTTTPPTTPPTTTPPTTTATTIPFDSVPEEAEVLGTTITTAPAEVSADTLPFTGFESEDSLKLGALMLLAGLLVLFAVRGPKEEETAPADFGGWSSL